MRLLHQKRLLVQHRRMKTFDQKAQRKNSLVLEGWNSDPECCTPPDSLFVAGQLHSKQFLQFPEFPGDIFILFPCFYFITNKCCFNLIIVHIPSIMLCFPSTIVWLLNICKAKKLEYYIHTALSIYCSIYLSVGFMVFGISCSNSVNEQLVMQIADSLMTIKCDAT